ncbi:MAG: hypothetical protein JRF63_01560 [Deltaproteobacteria bacterium]|nr:hypothetical protein [Deltaproteobacteria bacterium]
MNRSHSTDRALLLLTALVVVQTHGCREGRALAELSDGGAPDADADADTDSDGDASTYSDTDADSDTDTGTSAYACDGEPTLDFLHTVEPDETWSITDHTLHAAQTFVPQSDAIDAIEIEVQEPNADLGPHEIILARHESQTTVWSDTVDIPQSSSTPIDFCIELTGVAVEMGEVYSLHIHASDDTDADNPLVWSAASFDAYPDGAAWLYSGEMWDDWIEQPMDFVLAVY